MAQNLKLDPLKRDYVVKDGRPVPTDRIEEQIYFALAIPKDRWMYGGPDQGSLLYTLQNQMHGPSTEQQFATYTEDAIQRQLIATGKATAQAVGNLEITREGSQNKVEVVPAEQQLSTQLNFSPV